MAGSRSTIDEEAAVTQALERQQSEHQAELDSMGEQLAEAEQRASALCTQMDEQAAAHEATAITNETMMELLRKQLQQQQLRQQQPQQQQQQQQQLRHQQPQQQQQQQAQTAAEGQRIHTAEVCRENGLNEQQSGKQTVGLAPPAESNNNTPSAESSPRSCSPPRWLGWSKRAQSLQHSLAAERLSPTVKTSTVKTSIAPNKTADLSPPSKSCTKLRYDATTGCSVLTS